MRIVRNKATQIRMEFVHRGKDVIREALAEFFASNPDVYSLSFNLDFDQSGHDYTEYTRIWDFRAKLEPISPGLGNDLDNYVEIHKMPVGHILRDYVGSMALVIRELRYSAAELLGCGNIILKREDWVPVEEMQYTKEDVPNMCVSHFMF